jgi:8-oxo-dGTP diphosphatase
MFEFGEERFFKSAITVDNVIFGFDEGDLKVLLIKRGTTPYKGFWALPGDFVYPDEGLVIASARVLKELTGLSDVYLEQVETFANPNRHPLGRVITTAYFSLIKIKDFQLEASGWASNAQWISIDDIENLAFDHFEILNACFQKLKRRVRVQPIGFELLPPKFTLTELQHLYQAILQTDEKGIDKRNFRKKILSMDLLIDLDEVQEGVAHRPAKLYQFDPVKYEKLVDSGFSFEL